MPILVIVESPGKIKKIGEYLGSNYLVKASYGHCRDLNPKNLSIDVDNNFKPNYQVIGNKQKVVRELKYLAKDCTDVILAADEDREGEMIAASLKDLLNLKNPKRIVFHEITKQAIQKAVDNPTIINDNMVFAQQARRLLDRLVGYRLSPLLWKRMNGLCSAGRVQSVVVKIIIDKENKINNSISSPYFKINGNFKYKKKTIKSVLQKGNKLIKLDSEPKVLDIINQIKPTSKIIIIDVTNKESIRKPPAPFTTSTLQQEASSRLKFNVKRTMDAAQKLYEAGFITYMRTDSTNLSKDAMKACKDYIIKTYGEKYYLGKQHNKKSKGAQEAHEAIRPTKLDLKSIGDKLSKDCQRLYNLIWKRTIASQMSNAILNIQLVSIDILNNDKSILPKGTFFVSSVTTIVFDGFLILYNTVSENETIDSKADSITKNKVLTIDNIIASQEYSKPPTRYNEASLVKELEKQGIGRPSTYASIISKVIDRKYVEITEIKGVEKDSLKIELNKSFKVKKATKKVTIGKEKNKIKPTHIGIQINTFLGDNFSELMDIKFTAKMEKLLDKVALGKKQWFKVLDTFYSKFNPIVEKLESENVDKKPGLNQSDKLLGINPDTQKEIYIGESKFGPYLKTQIDEKWKFTSIKSIDNITLQKAIKLLAYPKFIGKIGKSDVYLNKGKYGFYVSKGKTNLQIDKFKLKPEQIDITKVKEMLDIGDPSALKSFTYKKRKIYLKQGPYGKYLSVTKKGKKINVKLPDGLDENKLTLEIVVSLINEKMSNLKKYKKT